MNKNILFTSLGESPTLRRWMAEKLHDRFSSTMPLSLTEEMLDLSESYRTWALEQFNGELLIDHDYKQMVYETITQIKSLAVNDKIKAIKFLREKSYKNELLREAIIDYFPYLTIEFLNRAPSNEEDPIVSDTGALTIRFCKKFVEYVTE